MANLNTGDIKPFIGARDFAESRDFYTALGWRANFDNGDLAELELGGFRFFLQNYYQRQWCENTMLHITVEDAEAWYRHVTSLLAGRTYGAARAKAPEVQSHGALVTFVWDPAGVLLHFSQPPGQD
jgi:catechol 2,3-dioxygenase-like lactoylglutathione lyase family enzyme